MSSTAPVEPAAPAAPMSHRAVLQALSGLLMGMFVAILAGTVVSTSLPRIVNDLGGSQTGYTWVVVGTLLATTVSTPIWGKLADLMSRKTLVQIALVIFIVGSALAGFSQNTETLIGLRVLQGLGAGGLTALVQVVIADIISPRERGRYMGLMGGVMAVGTVGGPLLGGLVTDAFGWRWNFYLALPFAIAAILLIQRTLHLPVRRRKVRIDYLGAALLSAGVSLLLIWVSLGGNQFEWNSAVSWLMLGGALLLLVVTVVVELRIAEPILPLGLFRNRTFTLAVVASISVGVAMFGTSVFLAQYMQIARGATPTESGLLTLPMVAGLLIASTVIGQVISRTGVWKRYVVIGSVLLTVGLVLMGTIRYDTTYALVALYMLVLGAGVGMTMQNLVLVTQNSLPPTQLGVGSAGIAFFRSLGGTLGVSALGAVLGSRVSTLISDGLSGLGVDPSAIGSGGSSSIPDVSSLPEPVRIVVESAYGEGVADLFLLAVPLAVITIVMVSLLPNVPLGTRSGVERLAERTAEAEGEHGPVQPNVLEGSGERMVEVAANDIGSTTSTGTVPVVRSGAPRD
jgi:EmrB/QacA subfamily drug resistance transporter